MGDIKAVFIIAGHSKFNPGAESNGLKERDLVKKITLQLAKKLEKIKDFETFALGFIDQSLEDKTREINMICKSNGYTIGNSIVIEIHVNAGGGTGIEVLGYRDYTPFRELGFLLVEHTVKTTGLKDRGLKDGKEFYIIKNTTPLALLVECGFIDTEKDREVLKNNINSFSDGIYDGLKEYIGFEEELFSEEMYIELAKENKELRELLDTIRKISTI